MSHPIVSFEFATEHQSQPGSTIFWSFLFKLTIILLPMLELLCFVDKLQTRSQLLLLAFLVTKQKGNVLK